jgi:hypothetical protein
MDAKGLDAVGSMEEKRESAEEAEYMELKGALKDADCEKVEVDGGVSSKLGCCDRFEPRNSKVQQFRCGECEYLR